MICSDIWHIISRGVRHVFIFVELSRFVGEQIGFEVLVFGPAGPDIEPGRCTFLSILVFRIFF